MNKNIKILVVDDSEFMRQFIIGYLFEAGFRNIIEASNGQAAIDSYSKEIPQIVFLDMIMPIKTGHAALSELVALGAKVIVISAIGQKTEMDEAIKAGAKDFIVKPYFDATSLTGKIAAALL